MQLGFPNRYLLSRKKLKKKVDTIKLTGRLSDTSHNQLLLSINSAIGSAHVARELNCNIRDRISRIEFR